MIHWKLQTVRLDFEGDCEWDRVETEIDFNHVQRYIIVLNNQRHLYTEFEEDAWEMSIEDFKAKWQVKDLQILGRSHCKAGYTDRLHPERSWTGHNPATLEKLRKYMEQLEKEERENGSKP